ncbi:MAG: glycosyltransferase family 4 protein [Methylocystis sp.]
MRVMFTQRLHGIAGSERYLMAIMPEMARRGVDVSFLMIRRAQPNDAENFVIAELEKAGVRTRVIETRRPVSVPLLWSFRDILRAERPDILQTNLLHSDVYGAVVKSTLSRPPILVSCKHGYQEAYQTAHGFDPTRLCFDAFSATTWLAARNADAVTPISTGLGTLLVEGRLVGREKVRVIPYGFDFSHEPSGGAPGAFRYGERQIVSVGRHVAVKQLHVLINAMPRLRKSFPDVKLVLVGDGPDRGALEQLAWRNGVSEQVVFVGFQNNVLDYIRDSDIFALSSAAEGFGRVILEAWWHRKAVVCFDVPAPNEIVTHDRDGLLVPARDQEAFAAALESLLADPQRMMRLGEAGRKTYEENFTMGIMVDRTIALYEELLGRKERRGLVDGGKTTSSAPRP